MKMKAFGIILILLNFFFYSYANNKEILHVEYYAYEVRKVGDVGPVKLCTVLSIGKDMSKYGWAPRKENRKYIYYVGWDLYWVYKNYPTQGRLTYHGEICKVPYTYSESMPTLDWNIVDGDSIVCGYHCQKAQTTFRGRTWTAWFSIDLPYSDGPWKLCGLPGLILKAYDSKGVFSFVAVEIAKGNGEDIKVDLTGKRMKSPNHFNKEMIAYVSNPVLYEKDLGKINYYIDGKTGEKVYCTENPWVPNLLEYFDEKK